MPAESRAERKNVPLRTCLGCGKKRQKQELFRFIAGQGGLVRLDEKGGLTGRGAYCCQDEKCLVAFVKKTGKVAKVLRCAVVECGDILDLVKKSGKDFGAALNKLQVNI